MLKSVSTLLPYPCYSNGVQKGCTLPRANCHKETQNYKYILRTYTLQ